MRCLALFLTISITCCWPIAPKGFGQEGESISLATHNSTLQSQTVDQQQVEQIRRIVLNQGNTARALANLVQLARHLPKQTASELYFELATNYLERGQYNQAGNLLQQLMNQYPKQSVAQQALLRLVRLYASSEVQHTEAVANDSGQASQPQQGFAKYATYLASTALRNDSELSKNSAFTFQRSVAMRLDGRAKAAHGSLTRLKRDLKAEPWRSRALAEQWLHSDRQKESPLSTLTCLSTEEHPHLDGVLDEPFWQAEQQLQFTYNEEFLYLAVSYPKQKELSYESDSRPRKYDADLAAHDHVKIRLDVDRDYATCYELAVNHRGQTHDCCWLDASWNPQWFVAAESGATHWTVEAAIPFESLLHAAPQPGQAWAISAERVKPISKPDSSSPASETFSLLLFE